MFDDDSWGPSPVDIDDIHDYYEAQRLGRFLRVAVEAGKLATRKEKECRERHIFTKIANALAWLSDKLLQWSNRLTLVEKEDN